MFKTLLIANRGEIARRVMRTAKRMGIKTVAVYSEPDADAPHVKEADEAVLLGPAPSAESYLRADKILEAAKQTGAEAIHPGYGFLSENADFARACAAAGIKFVGPSAESIEAMGLKDRAKKLMEEAGVPVTPGYHGDNQDLAHLKNAADAIGYPVLIKAVAGGGGKGMRKVEAEGDFLDALDSCKREAKASFGNEEVLIEKFIENPRHIEVQVFGDSRGRVIHLFERDCSLQRRHQKVIEEAPAPGMTPQVRAAMCSAAVQAAKAVNYEGAGTIEFIVDGSGALREDGFYFMEMNTRLQVEHPVTEMVTGLDLVELQLKVAAGGSVPEQDEISLNGHAIEARLYAEDPANGFLPSIGKLEQFKLSTPYATVKSAGSIEARDREQARSPFGSFGRIDSAVWEGGEVSIHYDPMIAKVIVWRESRGDALVSLSDALSSSRIRGVKTNAAFLVSCLKHGVFQAGDVETGFIDANLEDLLSPPLSAAQSAMCAAAALRFFLGRPNELRSASSDPIDRHLFRGGGVSQHLRNLIKNSPGDAWSNLDAFRMNRPNGAIVRLESEGREFDVHVSGAGNDFYSKCEGEESEVLFDAYRREPDRALIFLDNVEETIRVRLESGRIDISVLGYFATFTEPRPDAAADAAEAGGLVKAPMPGKVLSLNVAEGDAVVKGQKLLVLEAMKMEHALAAPRDGVIASVSIAAGDQVGEGDALVTLADEDEAAA